jgi:hypothetical protein
VRISSVFSFVISREDSWRFSDNTDSTKK